MWWPTPADFTHPSLPLVVPLVRTMELIVVLSTVLFIVIVFTVFSFSFPSNILGIDYVYSIMVSLVVVACHHPSTFCIICLYF